jgi:predicted MFS family arabinose efflux permease
MMGPALGSLVFGFFGYQNTFLFFGGLLAVGTLLMLYLLPSSVNYSKGKVKKGVILISEDQNEDSNPDLDSPLITT